MPFFGYSRFDSGEGLCGWNCRHSFGPGKIGYNPYKDFDAEENKKVYDLSQKQRGMESAIRHTKSKLVGQQTAIDNCSDPEAKAALQVEYDKTALKLKQQNEAYNRFCKDNDLRRYDDRLQIARWNRSNAINTAKSVERERQRKEIDHIREKIYNEINPTGAKETFGTLPNATSAATTQSKLQGYLLNSNHPVGTHKAKVINSVLGYHYENWNELADKMYHAVQSAEVTKIVNTKYGVRYTVPMRIVGRKGKSIILNSVWQIDTGEMIPRLITTTFNKKTIRKE